MSYYDDGTLLIDWDEINQWVLVVRKENIYVEGKDFFAGANKIVELVQEKQAGKVLGDYTNMRVINREDQNWFTQDWAPRAYDAGLRYFVGVAPRSYAAQTSLQMVMKEFNWAGIKTAIFEDLEAATEWLKSN